MTTRTTISTLITAKTRGGVVMASADSVVQVAMHHACQCQHQCLMGGCGAKSGCMERAM